MLGIFSSLVPGDIIVATLRSRSVGDFAPRRPMQQSKLDAWQGLLFAVGDPDVFDLGGVLEEEAVGGGGGVEPVDLAAFVGEDLF